MDKLTTKNKSCVELAFESNMDKIETLVSQGYEKNSDQICKLLTKSAENSIALRYFIQNALKYKSRRTLTGAQSYIVFKSDLFFIRINMWFPEKTIKNDILEEQDKYFSVDLCHNHNYDFFTVGVFGSGYFSNYFSTKQDLSELSVGDKVKAHKKWNIQLTSGFAMYVAGDTFFHTQHRPKEFSMSMNLIPIHGRQATQTRQYILEKNQETIYQIFEPN